MKKASFVFALLMLFVMAGQSQALVIRQRVVVRERVVNPHVHANVFRQSAYGFNSFGFRSSSGCSAADFNFGFNQSAYNQPQFGFDARTGLLIRIR